MRAPYGKRYRKPDDEKKDLSLVLSKVKREVRDYQVPVVTMIATNKGDPFKVLIATVLSLRTRDETTLAASDRLFSAADTPSGIKALGEKKVAKLIYPVGFYPTKAKNIIRICSILLEQYGGKVPRTMAELLALPNVGRKTANLVLTLGYGIVDGIAVDTHCHRIPNRMGFIQTKAPDQTEKVLMELLPKKAWGTFNDAFVAFGQGRCKPIGPRCEGCPVREWCDYGTERNAQ